MRKIWNTKKRRWKKNSNKNKNIRNELKVVTNFEENKNIDKINNNNINENNTFDDELTNKINSKISKISNEENINLNLKQLNNITQDTDNINALQPSNKSSNNDLNLLLQKEMEIENIQFDNDSILFTDLDLIGLDFEQNNKNKIPKKDGIPPKNNNKKNIVNPLNLCDNKLRQKSTDTNNIKPHKSVDNFNLMSQRINTTYDRDSINICLKKTPTKNKKIIKKTKSNIDFNKSPSINKSKSKSKNKLSHKLSKDNKTIRNLSPFDFNKSLYIKNLFKKNDKINLSRNELSEDIVFNLAEQIKKNREKIKEIKLIKCGITDDGAVILLKALEECPKLNVINLANNSLSDKIVNNVVSLLNKNYCISSCYFTNNNFFVSSKEKIKSYNRNGKIKIFV